MKNVLVSGGTRGLGLAMADRLARDGYHVIATGRSLSDSLQKLIDREDAKGKVTFVALDLRESDRVPEIVRSIVQQHGRLYGLVNNAAIGRDGVLATMHDTEIEDLLRVNLLGTMLLTKYASRSMLLSGEGRIVNVASIVARTGFRGLSVYGATKAALLGFTRSLSRELGEKQITVNSVSPGFLETEMSASISGQQLDAIRRRSPLGRLASLQDVASAVAYLLSDQAAGVTGTDIVVDAGSTA